MTAPPNFQFINEDGPGQIDRTLRSVIRVQAARASKRSKRAYGIDGGGTNSSSHASSEPSAPLTSRLRLGPQGLEDSPRGRRGKPPIGKASLRLGERRDQGKQAVSHLAGCVSIDSLGKTLVLEEEQATALPLLSNGCSGIVSSEIGSNDVDEAVHLPFTWNSDPFNVTPIMMSSRTWSLLRNRMYDLSSQCTCRWYVYIKIMLSMVVITIF